MKKNFGLQMFSLRDVSADYETAFKKTAEMGFAGVEFAGYYGLGKEQMKEMLEKNGLRAFSTHLGPDRLRAALKEEIEYNLYVGNRHIVCPFYPIKTADDVLRAAEEFNEWAEICEQNGMKFGYHNHDFEFKPLEDGRIPMDILIENTSDKVKLQPDTRWVRTGGLKPEEFIQKNSDRILSLHLQEYGEDGGSPELGCGVLDWKAIYEAGENAGAEFYILEQELYTLPVYDSIALCAQNIEKIF